MRTRISDVARKADVSTVTASRAFTSPGLLAPVTRDRVLRVAEQLGYIPNRLARGLRSGKTGTIAVVTSNLTQRLNTLKLDMLQRELMRNGYQTLLLQIEGTGDSDLAFLSDCVGTVDAIVLCRLEHPPGFERIGKMIQSGFPVVSLEHCGDLEIDVVTADREAGSRLATQYLYDLGHREIALGQVSLQSEVVARRERGYRLAMQALGLEAIVISQESGAASYFQHGFELAQRSFAEGRRPTAWIFPDDEMAVGAMRAFDEAGIRVPEDVSVIGWDDSPLCDFVQPKLTSVTQPVREVVSGAIERLLNRIHGSETLAPGVRMIAPSLVLRDSCAAVAGCLEGRFSPGKEVCA